MRLILLLILAAAAWGQPRPTEVRCTDNSVGGTDTYTCTSGFSLAALSQGTVYYLTPLTANTGAASLAIDSAGAVSIKCGASDCADGTTAPGKWTQLRFDGTYLQPVNTWASASAATQERSVFVPSGVRSQQGSTNISFCAFDAGVTFALSVAPYTSYSFPESQDYWAHCRFQMPNDYNGGNVKVILHLMATNSAAQTYQVRTSVLCTASGAAFANSTTTNTEATVTTDAGATDRTDVTITGVAATGCSGGLSGWLSYGRVGTSGSDTSTQTMAVLGAEIRYVSIQ